MRLSDTSLFLSSCDLMDEQVKSFWGGVILNEDDYR